MWNYLEVTEMKIKAITSSRLAAKILKRGRIAVPAFKIPGICAAVYACPIYDRLNKAQMCQDVIFNISGKTVICKHHFIETVGCTYKGVLLNWQSLGLKASLGTENFLQAIYMASSSSKAQIGK